MTDSTPSTGLTYRDAGVDIDAGNELVERIKPAIKRTHRPGAIGAIGGFGGLFELPVDRYKQPILVSGTDGVGTKLRLAIQTGRHDGVGIDLVAMCVNDIIVTGAEPLYFLDYYASGKLSLEVAERVINGIAKGCELAGAALIGGETAEMPDMYEGDDYDLAGFSVGVVEKAKIITGENVAAGQVILGLPSTGVHSNGFSLVRKIIEISQSSLDSDIDGYSLGERLMVPTAIYVKPLLNLLSQLNIHAMAHITGGGLSENIPRVMPEGTVAEIDTNCWERPILFKWLQEKGGIAESEMLRTFNCGIGMAIVVDQAEAENAIKILAEQQQEAQIIGRIIEADNSSDQPVVRYL